MLSSTPGATNVVMSVQEVINTELLIQFLKCKGNAKDPLGNVRMVAWHGKPDELTKLAQSGMHVG